MSEGIWGKSPVESIRARLQATLDSEIDRMLMGGIAISSTTCTTNQLAEPQPPFDFNKALRDWGKMIREARRNYMTIEVVHGHIGPMLLTEHPTDGRFVECSYEQACEIDKIWPLRFMRAVTMDRAQFAPAVEGVPYRSLFPPPYEVRDAWPSRNNP